MLEALGRHLHRLRKQQEKSLQAVSESAKISAAYLQKLERGKVNAPSPHVLRRLAQVLATPYASLLDLAGYLPDEPPGNVPRALTYETLSPEEWRAVLTFVRYLKEQR